jgi:MFS family permease
MGTSSSLITILNSVWNLGPVSQLFGSNLVGKKKRKDTLQKIVSIEAFAWLFIAFIGFMYLKGISPHLLPFLTIAGLGVMVFAEGVGHPSWFSLMGDVVDDKFRGKWWSKRSTIISFSTIVLSIISALLLNYLKSINNEIIGFISLFVIAAIARIYCIYLFGKFYEPKLKIKKEKTYTFKHFLGELEDSNFGRFVMFRGMLAFTIGLTSPLISIYLLRYIKFDYLTFIVIILSGTLFSILTLNLWGKISDRYGNFRVIALTTLIIPLTPLLWILSTSKIYLFFIPAILGGTAWSAFIMASGNFLYDNIGKQKRGKAIAYYNLFVGLGAFAGGLVSALLIKTIQVTWIEPLYVIFIIGTFARMLVVAFWIPKLKEIKRKEEFKGFKELKRVAIKEAKPTLVEDLHEIASISSYLRAR